jgi:plasmid stabilization system protein ParE
MVKWTKPARSDLKQVHDYIAQDSTFYAKKVVDEVVAKSELLSEFPQLGRVVPEIDDPNIREVFVYSYRLIYEIQKGDVTILGLIHGKRDFSSGNLVN